MSRPRADLPRRAPRRPAVPALLLLATALAAGCSLFPEPKPADLVYSVPQGTGPALSKGAHAKPLRLRSITPAAHLDDGISWRSGLQVGDLPGVRWSDRPDVVVERALLVQLFSDGRLVRSEALTAPLLDVVLLSFEELLDEGGGVACVELRARVLDESRTEVLSVAVESRQPIAAGDDHVAALARALGAGVDDACTRLAAEIVSAFGR